MKNILLLFFMLASLSMASITGTGTDMLEFRLGGNFAGKYEEVHEKYFKSESDPQGASGELMVELSHRPLPYLITGLGIGYQRSSKVRIKETDYSVIDTIPVYITAKYVFNNEGSIQPFLKANLGASLSYTRADLERSGGKAKTGFYYAVGGGLEYHEFIVDLSYQYNGNELDEKYSGKVEYTRFTFALGYRLDI